MIQPRFYPVTARIAGRLGLTRSLEDAAVDVSEIAPADTEPMRPVAIFPEDREKITASAPGSTLPQEWNRLKGHRGTNIATIRYLLRDVLATPFGVYQPGQSALTSGQLRLKDVFQARIGHVSRGSYAASLVSPIYFGHWLMDALPMTALCEEDEALCLPIPTAWRVTSGHRPHAMAIVEALDLPRLEDDFVHFDELAVYRDHGHNHHRRARTAVLRTRYQQAVRDRLGPVPAAQGVYISRGRTGVRREIVNEPALIEALATRGFTTIRVTEPIENIWRAVLGASRVVSLEGSNMTHAFYLAADEALFLTINPADRFHLLFADYMTSLSGRLATVVAVREGEGYRVDVDAILRMLDQEAP